ncbi:hypothetical protein BO82DRAFT_431669 [Aspergillus uvarum CBS 121591]|uniref:Uncharacterized protein n=1 Tax=Aspergillus uvarum CBS 121591 TaxID=1448315 RepID=A0A319CDX4_9EURO|nr:hypothetical protein BO82DRAFT_431669 [Aspergillus uvarum CBS 121591]PYH82429.1 hypothetical protein BO82DRAFT_431669 [Aspergillus uvarum CBS 121591]
MADILPAGAPFSGNLGIYSTLTATKPNFGNVPVFLLWNTLCATYFPPGEGFKTAVSRPALRDNTEPALAVVTGRQDAALTILAATAIGTKVKFWRYDAPSSHLESDVPTLSPNSGVLDLSEGHGQNGAVQMLAYVRNEGFNWTESGKGGIH